MADVACPVGEDCDIEEPTDDWSRHIIYGENVFSEPLHTKDYLFSTALLLLTAGVIIYAYRKKGESRIWARAETAVLMLYGLCSYFAPNVMYQSFVSTKLIGLLAFNASFNKAGGGG